MNITIEGVNDTDSMIVNNMNMLMMRYHLCMNMIKHEFTHNHVSIVKIIMLAIITVKLLNVKRMITVENVMIDAKHDALTHDVSMIAERVNLIHDDYAVRNHSFLAENAVEASLMPIMATIR